MITLIIFHDSADVPPHTAQVDIIPRKGDLIQIPSIAGRSLFPVKRIIFLMTRTNPEKPILSFPDDSPQVRIHLGMAQEE